MHLVEIYIVEYRPTFFNQKYPVPIFFLQLTLISVVQSAWSSDISSFILEHTHRSWAFFIYDLFVHNLFQLRLICPQPFSITTYLSTTFFNYDLFVHNLFHLRLICPQPFSITTYLSTTFFIYDLFVHNLFQLRFICPQPFSVTTYLSTTST